MDPRLRNAVAKIEVLHGGEVTSRGTGTLVARDLVLTALHVVGNRHSDPVEFLPGEIRLTFPDHTTVATPVDGKCHAGHDWALLRCATPPAAVPIPLGEVGESGGEWMTYGFPDAQPLDGMVQAGTVRNADARLGGAPVYQLFSEEASAGQGAPVRGLSGGPVLLDGALVGVLRYALMKEGQTVAGTLYACPALLAVEACEGLIPIPDPCHGLPGLPHRPLPAEPYRFLSRYREEDAEIFFGRNRSLRDVYEQVTSDDGAGVVLFYGQTGVGKSSFLDAGLVPRLRWTHGVRYLRREAYRSLLATLRHHLAAELAGVDADDDATLADLWLGVEEKLGRPIVAILDQVEEVYTRRFPGRLDEVAELGAALRGLFHGDRPAPRGQLVLGFRKEWYPEVQKRLDECGVEFGRVFLETMDGRDVVEAVTGLTRTRRLRARYGLTVAPELPPVLANQLGEDPDSPIAPTLQILLAKMWQTATGENAHAPQFTLQLYTRLKEEGALLGDFLDQQIAALARRRGEAVETGLVLDLLARHTTPLLTADECDVEGLVRDYAHTPDLPGLLTELRELYVLVDAAQDAAGAGVRTRLAHDTLAPFVRRLVDESAHPGQAATRILLSRAPRGAEPGTIAPLDGHDLSTVEAGLAGMRALGPAEQALLEASRVERARRRRLRATVKFAFSVLLVVLAAATAVALYLLFDATRQRHITDLSNTTDEVRGDLQSSPIDGLRLAFWAVCRSLDPGFGGDPQRGLDAVAPELQMSLSTAVEQAREERLIDLPSEVNSLSLHPGGSRFAVALESGKIQIRTLSELCEPELECYEPNAEVGDELRDGHAPRAARRVVFAPDGARLYGGGNDGRLRAWAIVAGAADEDPHTVDVGAPIRSLAVSADGKLVAAGDATGTIHLWSAGLARKVCTLQEKPPEAGGTPIGGVNAMAFFRDEVDGDAPVARDVLVAGSDDGVLRYWDPSAPDDAPIRVARHQGPVLAIATSRAPGIGPVVASGAADETVRLLDRGGRPLQRPIWRGDAEPEHDLDGHTLRDVVIADHDSAVRAVEFAPDGTRVLSGDERGIVLLHDLRGEPFARPLLGPNDAVRALEYTLDDDGCEIALIGSLDHTVRVRSPLGLKIGDDLRPNGAAVAPGDPAMLCVAYSADGKRLAGGGEDGVVTVWEVATQEVLARCVPDGGDAAPRASRDDDVVALQFAGDLVAASYRNGTLRVWSGRRCVGTVTLGSELTALTSDPSGRHVVLATQDGAVRRFGIVREGEAGARIEEAAPVPVDPSRGPVSALALSEDGGLLAVARANTALGAADAEVTLHALDGRQAPGVPLTSSEKDVVVRGLAFDRDGHMLLRLGDDGLLHVSRLYGNRSSQTRKAHLGAGLSVRADRAFTRVVTGGVDGRVVMWGIGSDDDGNVQLDRIAELVPAHAGPVRAVAFGGAGERFAASAGEDGAIRIWRAHCGLWLDLAWHRLRVHLGPDPDAEDPERPVGAFLDDLPWRRTPAGPSGDR